MEFNIGSNMYWREFSFRIILDKHYHNRCFMELNFWKWFITAEFKLKYKEGYDD